MRCLSAAGVSYVATSMWECNICDWRAGLLGRKRSLRQSGVVRGYVALPLPLRQAEESQKLCRREKSSRVVRSELSRAARTDLDKQISEIALNVRNVLRSHLRTASSTADKVVASRHTTTTFGPSIGRLILLGRRPGLETKVMSPNLIDGVMALQSLLTAVPWQVDVSLMVCIR